MKSLICTLIFVWSFIPALTQSILLEPNGQSVNGKTAGLNQIDINDGGLLIQTTYLEDTLSEQTETNTMNCSSEAYSFSSSGILLDPSGTSNYNGLSNYDCTYRILGTNDSSFSALRISFLMLDTDAIGDSVFLEDYSTGEVYYKFAGNTLPSEDIFFPTRDLRVRFKTDADRNVGKGFRFFWSEILQGNPQNIEGFKGGNVLLFDVANASLTAGRNTLKNVKNSGFSSITLGENSSSTGRGSISLGSLNKAANTNAISVGERSVSSAENSLALGYFTEAMGKKSVAIATGRANGDRTLAVGYLATADSAYSLAIGPNSLSQAQSSVAIGSNSSTYGQFSVAIGKGTEAIGMNSLSIGYGAKAAGGSSIALGGETTSTAAGAIAIGNSSKASGIGSFTFCSYCEASGDYSTSLGNKMYTNGKSGTFMIGDEWTGATDHYANVSNRMITRFRNGYYFYTNASNTIGVKLLAGDNSWSTASDSTLKENFIAANGEGVLQAVSQMRVGTWNYKTQDPSRYRHWGVMAQDFYKHFGKDKYGTVGSDTLIASADFDGVAFAAIKALEKRTQMLQKENKELRKVFQSFALLKKEMEDIKHLLAEKSVSK